MKALFVLIIALLAITSCGGENSRSAKERKAFTEELKKRKPVKISEEQVITKAYAEARNDLKDTVVTEYLWKTFIVQPGDSVLIDLWKAYQHAAQNKINATDNVQIDDSVVIYTKPIIKNDTLQKMLVAYLPKKSIILKLSD